MLSLPTPGDHPKIEDALYLKAAAEARPLRP
jgi:hypothetical protein